MLESRIATLEATVADREATLAVLGHTLAARDAGLAEKAEALAARDAEVEALRGQLASLRLELADLRERFAFDIQLAALKSGEPAPAADPVAPAPAPAADQPLTSICFDTGSASLTPGGQVHAAAAAVMLADMKLGQIRLVGFTDRTGSPARNQRARRGARPRRRRLPDRPGRAAAADRDRRRHRRRPAGPDRPRRPRAAQPLGLDRRGAAADDLTSGWPSAYRRIVRLAKSPGLRYHPRH